MLRSLDGMLAGISARPEVHAGAEDVALEIPTLDAKQTRDIYCVPTKCHPAALLQCLWPKASPTQRMQSVNIPEKLLQGVPQL